MSSNPGGEALYNAYLATLTPEPEPDEDSCACQLTGAKPYLLEIQENRITGLACTACGKNVMAEWIEDVLSTKAPLPVTVTWEYSPPDYWGEDPGYTYGEITPRRDGAAA